MAEAMPWNLSISLVSVLLKNLVLIMAWRFERFALLMGHKKNP
jgi:hypothetical protein